MVGLHGSGIFGSLAAREKAMLTYVDRGILDSQKRSMLRTQRVVDRAMQLHGGLGGLKDSFNGTAP